MKICYIGNADSIHTQRWVNYFARKGHEVHLITEKPGEGYFEGVRLHQLPFPIPRSWPGSGYINALAWCIRTRRLVKRIKPDIIDTHYISTRGYLSIATGFHPVVFTAVGTDILIDPRESRLYRFLTKYTLRKAEIVICDSETIRRELIALGMNPDNIRIIYNGIDIQQFSPQPADLSKKRMGLPGVPVIISTRNFRPVYNIEMLIRAIPLFLKHSSQVRFLLIGDGDQREYLENLADSLGISGSISFLGRLPHDELPGYLTSADIYVSTSRSDSTSMSLQEAMACELAPVVTDLPANREWIKDGENGFIVPQNDPQALAERCIYLMENKEIRERFCKEGRRIIVERGEYNKEMGKVEKLYEEMISSRKSTGKKSRA